MVKTMLLTGTYLRTLDEKRRFAIPKRIRDALGCSTEPVVYLAPGTDGSLSLYALDAFNRLADQLDRVSPTAHDVRAFSRMFFAHAQSVELDRQGRVRVSPELAELASLTKEIVLVGVRDHLEIWDRSRWEDYLQGKQSHYDEIAENAFGRSDFPNVRVERGDRETDADVLPLRPR